MSTEKMYRKKRALIIVDHGSSFKEANDMLIEIANMVRKSCKGEIDIVKHAHMELAKPTISEAFNASEIVGLASSICACLTMSISPLQLFLTMLAISMSISLASLNELP